MGNIRFTGTKRLKKKLGEVRALKELKKVIHDNTVELANEMQEEAIFTRGYSKGNLRRSISFDIRDKGLTGRVAPNTEYDQYPEWGTRFMDAQPYAGPALNKQGKKFIEDLNKLMR